MERKSLIQIKLKNKKNFIIKKCRICNSKLEKILYLGKQPPANSLGKSIYSKIQKYELTLTRCISCHTLQLNNTINPKYLFTDYVWVTGTSSAARKHTKNFYKQTVKRINKNNKRYILEVASNDGTFLQEYKKNNHKVLGIDPAKNIAKIANKQGIKTIAEFFSLQSSKKIKLRYGSPDLIFARNVIPHVENINEVIESIFNIMDEKSLGCIEFHYNKKIYDEIQYDSIYHEHVFYFSLKTISNLLNKFALYAYDCQRSPISGGSLMLYFTKNRKKALTKNYINIFNNEIKTKINNKNTWKIFSKKVEQHRDEIRSLFKKYKIQKTKVFGYGASARSSTFLNFCKLDNKNIICIFDKSEHKHNKYTAGSNIEIKSTNEIIMIKPKIIILLAWNFKSEIIKYLKSIKFSGKIIIPFPRKPYSINI